MCSMKSLVVAAHPDDEVIGAGAQLASLNPLQIIFATDGAPRNGHDAGAHGFVSVTDYAQARRREAQAAAALAGLPPSRLRWLGIPDQETSFRLAELSETLHAIFLNTQPDLVLTHAYEGGHPDHDAVAFAVYLACQRLGTRAPVVVEMTSYYNDHGRFCAGRFLQESSPWSVRAELSPTEQQFKRELFACYKTQTEVLSAFPLDRESFRVAPSYDFTIPPHPGTLYYEMFDWGMSGRKWRELAAGAGKLEEDGQEKEEAAVCEHS
jgi:N-acetylglucosamine malate deacetylase 2